MEREALKKENGNKVPTPSSDLKKQLLSIRVIALAITSEQTPKIEEMLTTLKQTKKYKEKNAATLSDCRYLEYLLSVARTNQ